ncbi:MAG TPA: lytic murein transglycosylase [Rhodomicrobium sp.]|nr:lytic murein transglycosylase [Rhodomicrobium sp.]
MELSQKARAARTGIMVVLLSVSLVQAALAGMPSAEGFRAWIATFRATALEKGIRASVYDSVAQGLVPDFSLPDLDIPSKKQPEQPEFVRTPEQYLSEKSLANLAEQGRKLFAQYKDTLIAIKTTYRIDPYILLAVWGRETAFGTFAHDLHYNALDVLATEAYAGRRKDLFERQFIDALRMVQEGVIAPKDMKSSWAGAMGLVQFMPEDYFKYAVDQDGDGKKDIWHSVPDALASLAKNLQGINWNDEHPWGFEVRAPAHVDCSLGYLDIRKPVSDWAAMGIVPVKGGDFPPEVLSWEASLLQPAGIYGPAFLTFDNFQVIREYNKSDLYALFVGDLADRIRGGGSFLQPWQRIVQVPSSDVEYMQKRLTSLGLYSDTIDGKPGGRTRAAVGAYQKGAGLPQTCWPTAEIVAHLKAHAGAQTMNERGQN